MYSTVRVMEHGGRLATLSECPIHLSWCDDDDEEEEDGDVVDDDDDGDDDDVYFGDIYIMMQCLSVCNEKSSPPPVSLL